MIGIEMDIDVLPLVEAGYRHGVLLLNAGPRVLRLLPPLIITEEHINELSESLDSILSEYAAS